MCELCFLRKIRWLVIIFRVRQNAIVLSSLSSAIRACGAYGELYGDGENRPTIFEFTWMNFLYDRYLINLCRSSPHSRCMRLRVCPFSTSVNRRSYNMVNPWIWHCHIYIWWRHWLRQLFQIKLISYKYTATINSAHQTHETRIIILFWRRWHKRN